MTLGQSVKQTNTDENDYGREITVDSKSESIDKGNYYMPKFGFDFNISSKQYLGIEWSGNYSKDYANDSLLKRHKSVKRSQICKLENGRCSPALSTKIFTQFIYGGIIWSGFYLHWLFVEQNRVTYMSQMCIKLA